MKRKKTKRSWGWFGWTMLSVVLVTIIGSTVFFFTIFQFNISSLFQESEAANNSEVNEENSQQNNDETSKNIEHVQETVGKQHQEIGAFISETHAFYNETTGYGGINNLDWDEQQSKAKAIQSQIHLQLRDVKNESLKNDLEKVNVFAKRVVQDQSVEAVQSLHRYFHDLDIALNEYNGYDKIWNVTETLAETD
ncbi:hypothetical protein [Virgibacillus salexigens]|uniref:Uncharacterized protein n=1 Tax=Virgibacillus massiliensis TaxID=1462526 RepID=A0A024QE74_9BACI|nr:hypothetical protein [Virgibacillus massiliensis]CDQ40858.1 hypothetical protein BN990_03191 [Virgibacillus massiliensis]